MTEKFIEIIMNAWKKINCKTTRCSNLIGWSDSTAVIVGGTLISVPRVNILCTSCGVKTFLKLNSTGNSVKYLSESEVARIISAEIS